MFNNPKRYLLVYAFALTAAVVCLTADAVLAERGNAKIWKENRKQGQKALEERKYPAAETYFKSALIEAEKFGEKDDRLAESLDDLGKFYFRFDNFAAAEPLLHRLAEIRKSDPNPGLDAQSAYLSGVASEQMGHYDVALQSFLHANDVISKKVGVDHPLAVELMFATGRVYYAQQNYNEAAIWLKRAFNLFAHPASRTQVSTGDAARYGYRISRGKFRADYVKALEVGRYLNEIYFRQNNLAAAADTLKEMLKLVDENSSNDDPALMSVLKEMASFNISMTNQTAAEPILERLIKIQGKQLGKTNGIALETEAILASVYVTEKKNAAAETLYQNILVDSDKTFGAESRQSSVALGNLAKFETDQGNFEKAELLYHRLLIQTEKVQPDGIALMPILSGQTIVYQKLKRDPELLEVYQREIKIYEKMFGPTNVALINPLSESARLLRSAKRDSEAEILEARIKSIQKPETK